MKASVIVLAWNGTSYLGDCLRAVFSQTRADYEVIVVDNGSTDGSADFVAQNFPQAQLIRNGRNLGFSGGMNVGLRAARGDVMVLLNQDTQVRSDWLEKLVGAMSADASIGIAGCKILYPDGKIQHGGAAITNARGDVTHLGKQEPDHGQCDAPFDAEAVTGAALAISRAALDRIGSLDESFAPAYYEDIDWCYRARAAGYRVRYVPAAILLHHESPRLAQLDAPEMLEFQHTFHKNRLRFIFKHGSVDQIVAKFLSEETDWMSNLEAQDEWLVLAVRRAYLDTLLALGDLARWRQQLNVVGGVGELAATLVRLREACDTSRFWTVPTLPAGASASEHRRLLTELHASWAIKERPFHSDAQLVGPVVAGLRDAFNNISTRWYVLPIIQQQNEFNARVATASSALEIRLAALESGLTRLGRNVTELAQEITTLAEQLSASQHELSADDK